MVAIWVFDSLQWTCLHMIRIVAHEKLNERFAFKIKHDLFLAILRQDTIFFETHDAGAVQSLLKSDCVEVAKNFLGLPLEMFDEFGGWLGG